MEPRITSQRFGLLLAETSQALDTPDANKTYANLAEKWQMMPIEDIISFPGAEKELSELRKRLDSAKDHSPLRPTISRIERILIHVFQNEHITHSHLEKVLGSATNNQSFLHLTDKIYEGVSDQLNAELLFQIFSDDWGAGRKNQQERSLEGYSDERMLKFYTTLSQIMKREGLSSLSTELLPHYKETHEIAKNIKNCESDDDAVKICHGISERIKKLQPGETFYVPGGWQGFINRWGNYHVGHAQMFRVKRELDNTYSFAILDSGAGLQEFHEPEEGFMMFSPGVEWYGLPQNAIGQALWETLLEPQTEPLIKKQESRAFSSESIHTVARNSLERFCKEPRKIPGIKSIQRQRAGTCSRKSVDLIGRTLLEESSYKLLRIEQKVIVLSLLEHILRNRNLSAGDRQLFEEIYAKSYLKTWNAISKYCDTYSEPDLAEQLSSYIVTLEQINFRRLNNRRGMEIDLSVKGPIAPAEANIHSLAPSGENPSLPAVSKAFTKEIKAINIPDPPINDNELLSLSEQIKTVVEGVSALENVGPAEILYHLQKKIFERLPPLEALQSGQKLSEDAVNEFLLGLFHAVNLSFNLCQMNGYGTQQQIVDIWKAYAIATVISRRAGITSAPIIWAPWGKLCESPQFSLLDVNLAKTVHELSTFFAKDSPDGNRYCGENNAGTDTAIFDHSWIETSSINVGITPEIKLWKSNQKTMIYWYQLSEFAQQSISGEMKKENCTTIDVAKFKPRFSFSYKHQGFVTTASTSSPIITDPEPREHIQYWEVSEKIKPYMTLFSRDVRLEQIEVLRRANEENATNRQEAYDLCLISTSDPSLRLPLLLRYFESNPQLLLQKDYLNYFMSHIVSKELLQEAITAEPKFSRRLLKFLKKTIKTDINNLVSDAVADRLGHLLVLMAEMSKYDKNFEISLNKLRISLIKRLPKERSWVNTLAMRLMSTYAVLPAKEETFSDLFQLHRLTMNARSTGAFDLVARVRATEAWQMCLPQVLSCLANDEQRQKFVASILGENEKSLALIPFHGQTDLKTELLQMKAASLQQQELIKNMNEYRGAWDQIKQEQLKQAEKPLEDSERLKKALKTMEQHRGQKPDPTIFQEGNQKLAGMVQALPQAWSLIGTILILPYQGNTLEIDLSSGVIYRNGVDATLTELPPSYKIDSKMRPFGKALDQGCRVTSDGYKLETKGCESLTLKPNDSRDVLMDYKGEKWRLLDVAEMGELDLPQGLRISDITTWVKKGGREMIICGHRSDGIPEPLFTIDNKGQVHPMDAPSLILCSEVPDSVINLFGGVCRNSTEGLCWVDENGSPARLQLPINLGTQQGITFERKGNEWILQPEGTYHVAQDQVIMDFPDDSLYLVLETAGGKQAVLFEDSPIMPLLLRSDLDFPTVDPLLLKSTEHVGILIPIDNYRVSPKTTLQRLALAYKHLMWGNYEMVKEVLSRDLRPLGRPYNMDELKLLKCLVQSNMEKADKNSNASSLRLWIMAEMQSHLYEFPVEVKTLLGMDKDLRRFIVSWSPFPSAPELEDDFDPIDKPKAHFEQANEMYKSIKQGSEPEVGLSVTELFTPDQELLFLNRIHAAIRYIKNKTDSELTIRWNEEPLSELFSRLNALGTYKPTQPWQFRKKEEAYIEQEEFINRLVVKDKAYFFVLWDTNLKPEKFWTKSHSAMDNSSVFENHFREAYEIILSQDLSEEMTLKKERLRATLASVRIRPDHQFSGQWSFVFLSLLYKKGDCTGAPVLPENARDYKSAVKFADDLCAYLGFTVQPRESPKPLWKSSYNQKVDKLSQGDWNKEFYQKAELSLVRHFPKLKDLKPQDIQLEWIKKALIIVDMYWKQRNELSAEDFKREDSPFHLLGLLEPTLCNEKDIDEIYWEIKTIQEQLEVEQKYRENVRAEKGMIRSEAGFLNCHDQFIKGIDKITGITKDYYDAAELGSRTGDFRLSAMLSSYWPEEWNNLMPDVRLNRISQTCEKSISRYHQVLAETLQAMNPLLEGIHDVREAIAKIEQKKKTTDAASPEFQKLEDMIIAVNEIPYFVIQYGIIGNDADLKALNELNRFDAIKSEEELIICMQKLKKEAESAVEAYNKYEIERTARVKYEEPIRGGVPWTVQSILKDWSEGASHVLPAQVTPKSFESLKEGNFEEFTDEYTPILSDVPLISDDDLQKLPEEDRESVKLLVEDLQSYRIDSQKIKQRKIRSDAIQTIRAKIEKEDKVLAQKAVKVESEILNLANKLPTQELDALKRVLAEKGPRRSVIEINECIGLALRGQMALWQSRTSLTEGEVSLLQGKVMEYLLIETERQHLKQGLEKLNEGNLEDAGAWLTSKRAYTMDELIRGEAWEYLVFEYYSGFRVRSDQKMLIDRMSGMQLGAEAFGLVLQLVMGAGKSKLIAPILALKAANGFNVSTICLPSSLFATGSEDLSDILYRMFHIRTETLLFTRKECSLNTLYRIITKLDQAEKEGIILLHRPSDLHSLNMMMDERDELIYQIKEKAINRFNEWLEFHPELHGLREHIKNYILLNDDKLPDNIESNLGAVIEGYKLDFLSRQGLIRDYEQQIDLLGKILNRLEQRQEALFDEFDTIADPKNVLSFPIGESIPVDQTGIEIVCKLYFEMLTRFERQLQIASDGHTMLHREELDAVRKGLRDELWDKYQSNFPAQREVFDDYLQNKDTPQTQEFVKYLANMRESRLGRVLSDQIAFWKYALSKGLPTALSAAGHVGYERSRKEKDFEIVLPCEYNGTPKEGTRFKNVWEGAFKTCQFYRQNWNDPEQTRRLINFALTAVDPKTNTPVYDETLKHLFGNIEDIDTSQPDKLALYTEQLFKGNKTHSLKLIQGYLRHVVFPNQLKQDPVQLTSTPQDLLNVPKRSNGFSGTRAYHHTWSSRIKSEATSHTDAMNIDPLTSMANANVLIIPDDADPVTSMAKEGVGGFSASIDAGPIFKGVDNFNHAKQLLTEFNQAGGKKKAIVFYQASADGSSRLYLYKLGLEAPIPLRDSQKETLRESLGEGLTFSDLLTTFDHAHTIGSDIFQPDGSIAWVTIGDQLTKDKLLQAVARMRRLAAGKHFVKPVMKAKMANEIAKYLNKSPEELTTKDLVVFAEHVQTQKEIPVNSNSMREKLLFELKKEVRHQRLHAKNPEERSAIYEKYRSNLVTVQPKSLFAQFGAINRTVSTDELLHREAEQIGTELHELKVDRKEGIACICRQST